MRSASPRASSAGTCCSPHSRTRSRTPGACAPDDSGRTPRRCPTRAGPDRQPELIARTHPPREALIAYLDCEISYGTTRGWQVERSTLPWRQGQRLALADRIAIDAAGHPAPRAPGDGEAWSFPVVDLAPGELRALFP
jgi:hypothetical protein